MRRCTLSMLVAAPLLMLLCPLPVLASPLEPAHVPADAKWVVHVDLEALTQTAIAEKIRENRPGIVRQVRRWFQNRYGIEPREDLKSLTMFSDTYESHTGTMILRASYDLEKVRSEIENKPGVKKTTWQDHTLYTFSKNATGGRENRPGESAGAEASGRTMTIVLVDGETAVFASSPERAKSAVQLLQGEGSPLEQGSPLIADVPEGVMVYGAAIDLGSITQADGIFPVLRQHEKIVWYVGQDDGQVFDNLRLVASSEEVAEQMKTALEGMLAFGKVWAADSESLTRLMQATEISRDGKTVERTWRGDSQLVLGALGEVRDRLQKRLQSGGERNTTREN